MATADATQKPSSAPPLNRAGSGAEAFAKARAHRYEGIPVPASSDTPGDPIALDKRKGESRLAAEIYNKYGRLFARRGKALGIDPALLAAVVAVESGGKSSVTLDGKEKAIIRFENHRFFTKYTNSGKNKERAKEFNKYFTRGTEGKRWLGHEYRTGESAPWKNAHSGKPEVQQAKEREALEIAARLDRNAAYESASAGVGQLMGEEYKNAGYESAEAMFQAFDASSSAQVGAMIDWIASAKGGKMLVALQKGDATTFARYYNGSGQAMAYGASITAKAGKYRAATADRHPEIEKPPGEFVDPNGAARHRDATTDTLTVSDAQSFAAKIAAAHTDVTQSATELPAHVAGSTPAGSSAAQVGQTAAKIAGGASAALSVAAQFLAKYAAPFAVSGGTLTLLAVALNQITKNDPAIAAAKAASDKATDEALQAAFGWTPYAVRPWMRTASDAFTALSGALRIAAVAFPPLAIPSLIASGLSFALDPYKLLAPLVTAASVARTIGKGILTAGGWLGGKIADGAGAVWNGMTGAASWVADKVVAAGQNIGAAAGWLGGKVADGATAAWNGVSGAAGWAADKAVAGAKAVGSGVAAGAGWVAGKVGGAASAVGSGIASAGGWLWGKITGAADTMTSAVTQPFAPVPQDTDGNLTGPFFPRTDPRFGATGPQNSPESFVQSREATVFVNGVDTSFEKHGRAAQELADANNKPVVGVYNATGVNLGDTLWNRARDFGQSLTDKLGMASRNPAIVTLARLITDYGNPDDTKKGGLDLFAHSQGTIIVSEALRQAKNSGTNLSTIDVTTFGNAAYTMPSGLAGEHHYVFDDDAVASSAGSTSLIGGLARYIAPLFGASATASNTTTLHHGGAGIRPHGVVGDSPTDTAPSYISSLGAFRAEEAQRAAGDGAAHPFRSKVATGGALLQSLPVVGGMFGAMSNLIFGGGLAAQPAMAGGVATPPPFGVPMPPGMPPYPGNRGSTIQRSGGSGAADFELASRLDPALLRASLTQADPGTPLSGARIHTGAASARAADSLNAEAFTIGSDIFFGGGRYAPETPQGRGLLAHEMTHVRQQTGGGASGTQFYSASGGDAMEQEAQEAGRKAAMRLARPNTEPEIGAFAVTYDAGDGELSGDDHDRLTEIAAEALIDAKMHLMLLGLPNAELESVDADVEIDLSTMSDADAVAAWSEAIVSAITARVPRGAGVIGVQRAEKGDANTSDPSDPEPTIRSGMIKTLLSAVNPITALHGIRSYADALMAHLFGKDSLGGLAADGAVQPATNGWMDTNFGLQRFASLGGIIEDATDSAGAGVIGWFVRAQRWREVDSVRVEEIIRDAMAQSPASASAVNRVDMAYSHVLALRQSDPHDMSLVAAEHYFYSRAQVAHGGTLQAANLSVLTTGYEAVKAGLDAGGLRGLLRTGDHAVSPPSASVYLWGMRGVSAGMTDHDASETVQRQSRPSTVTTVTAPPPDAPIPVPLSPPPSFAPEHAHAYENPILRETMYTKRDAMLRDVVRVYREAEWNRHRSMPAGDERATWLAGVRERIQAEAEWLADPANAADVPNSAVPQRGGETLAERDARLARETPAQRSLRMESYRARNTFMAAELTVLLSLMGEEDTPQAVTAAGWFLHTRTAPTYDPLYGDGLETMARTQLAAADVAGREADTIMDYAGLRYVSAHGTDRDPRALVRLIAADDTLREQMELPPVSELQSITDDNALGYLQQMQEQVPADVWHYIVRKTRLRLDTNEQNWEADLPGQIADARWRGILRSWGSGTSIQEWHSELHRDPNGVLTQTVCDQLAAAYAERRGVPQPGGIAQSSNWYQSAVATTRRQAANAATGMTDPSQAPYFVQGTQLATEDLHPGTVIFFVNDDWSQSSNNKPESTVSVPAEARFSDETMPDTPGSVSASDGWQYQRYVENGRHEFKRTKNNETQYKVWSHEATVMQVDGGNVITLETTNNGAGVNRRSLSSLRSPNVFLGWTPDRELAGGT